MTDERMVYLLSLSTHRCQDWFPDINAQLLAGDSDFKDAFKDVVDQVKVSFPLRAATKWWIEYDVVDGEIAGLSLPAGVWHHMEEPDYPIVDELRLLEMVDREMYQTLVDYCAFLETVVDKSEEYEVRFSLMKDDCRGCGEPTEVNYFNHDGSWTSYCGGSPRCCP